MHSFVYDIPVKVYFGKDQLHNLSKEVKRFGTNVLLTYGGGSIKRMGLYDKVIKELTDSGITVHELSGIEPNPRIESVRKGAEICKEKNIDVLLAVGGGSTIDATKFIAAGAKVDHDPWEFISKNAPIKDALPIITILTLSATGSEMDAGGVITNPETREKLSRSSKWMLPKVSFLDPTNTYSVNAFQTASGAADILSHLFEVYFNMEKDLMVFDAFMEGLMRTVIKYAPIAIRKPENYEARANLMWASSWAINGFVSGGKNLDWSCHPIEHELSAFYDITHGLGLAILTPPWLTYCLDEERIQRYVDFGVNVFHIDPKKEPKTIAEEAIEKLSTFFFDELGLVSNLEELGVKKEDLPLMAKKACAPEGSIKGFKELFPEDVETIYEMCYTKK